MNLKTDDKALVGMHAFERAGLGKAPFQYVGFERRVYKASPEAPLQSGDSCDYCGTGLMDCFVIKSADDKLSTVGCNCVTKVGDEGLLKAFKTSPEFRKHQADVRAAKARAERDELTALISAESSKLEALPHPSGFTDRKTGVPLTLLDHCKWFLGNAGASGIHSTLRFAKRQLNGGVL